MRIWAYSLGIALASSIGDSIVAYMSFAFVSPETLQDPKAWAAFGVFIAFNGLKTVAAHLKEAPRFFNGLPPQDPPKS